MRAGSNNLSKIDYDKVIKLKGIGLSHKQVSDRLGIAVSTVAFIIKSYKNIKLGKPLA